MNLMNRVVVINTASDKGPLKFFRPTQQAGVCTYLFVRLRRHCSFNPHTQPAQTPFCLQTKLHSSAKKELAPLPSFHNMES